MRMYCAVDGEAVGLFFDCFTSQCRCGVRYLFCFGFSQRGVLLVSCVGLFHGSGSVFAKLKVISN